MTVVNFVLQFQILFVSLPPNQPKILIMTLTEIKLKIDNAKELEFGTVFNQAIELYKKSWLQGFILQLIALIISLPLILLLYLPFMTMIISQSENGRMDPNAFNTFFAGLSFLYMIFFVFGILIIAAISVALNAGFFRILKDLDHNQATTTSQLFYFFKMNYLGKIIGLMFITIAIAIPSALLCYIPLIYVIVPMSFFMAVFAFNPEMGIGDIISVSFKLGNKKWLLTFGLLIVSYILIMILAVVTCGLGSLFLAPFMYHPIYIIYKEVIGFDDATELNQIGELQTF